MRILCVVAVLCAAAVPAAGGESVCFRKVGLFDGEKYIARTSVLVQDGKIQAVGPSIDVPPNAKVIDGTGKTLLPGLLDAHAHHWFLPHLKQCAEFGVTSSMDMMTQVPFMRQTQIMQKKQRANGMADLFSAGAAVTVKGGARH